MTAKVHRDEGGRSVSIVSHMTANRFIWSLKGSGSLRCRTSGFLKRSFNSMTASFGVKELDGGFHSRNEVSILNIGGKYYLFLLLT